MALDLCVITGDVFNVDGTPADANTFLDASHVTKTGVALGTRAHTAKAANGVLTLSLPRGSTALLKGTVKGFEDEGRTVAIPDAPTANLASLLSLAYVPTSGIVVQDDGAAGLDKIGTLNFGAGLDVSYPTPGVAEIIRTGTGTPVIVKGANAQVGAGASIELTGTDAGFKVTLTTGTGITLAGALFTVTFAVPYSLAPHPAISAGSVTTAPGVIGSRVYVTTTTATLILTNWTALSDATVYVWEFVING